MDGGASLGLKLKGLRLRVSSLIVMKRYLIVRVFQLNPAKLLHRNLHGPLIPLRHGWIRSGETYFPWGYCSRFSLAFRV